jgi:hypothetical protein
MRIPWIALTAVFCTFTMASPAFAQRVPFFAGAATGFDPEISVVNSGQILDAQVAVSNDLKYVTINARAQQSQLLALREFSFAGGGRAPLLGFVGGAGRADGGGERDGNGGGVNALNRPGMSLVARLED